MTTFSPAGPGSALAAALGASDGSLTLTGGSLPTSKDFVVQIDAELVLVKSRSGDSCLIQRAYNGSTPIAHDAGAAVALMTRDPDPRPVEYVGRRDNTGPAVNPATGELLMSAGSIGGQALLTGGKLKVTRNVAPDDGDLAAGEAIIWFDPTNGAPALMVKAKQADGTVASATIALA